HVKSDNRVITCGFEHDNDVLLSEIVLDQKQTFFTYNQERTYHVPLLGKHHAKNAGFAVWIGKELDIRLEDIQIGFDQLAYTSMRFEWLEGKNDVTLINDAYNASYTSM